MTALLVIILLILLLGGGFHLGGPIAGSGLLGLILVVLLVLWLTGSLR